ncbi:MAG: energy transducer TonB [Ignavibacteriaceae bacterium]
MDVFPVPIDCTESILKKLVYPESARISFVEGEVIVKIIVDSKGEVTSIEVTKSLQNECDSVVVNAIKKTKFKPARRNGYAVETVVIIPVLFKLR